MKTIAKRIFVFLFFLVLPVNLTAQELDAHEMIGKSRSEVLKKYGKPVHQDNSIPSMVCLFYKTANNSMTFVANSEGVYQVEQSVEYNTEDGAYKALNKFIENSKAESFAVDTVSTSAFKFNKPGVNIEIQMYPNQITKKIAINLKGKRYGG